jgi:hypothetical protein
VQQNSIVIPGRCAASNPESRGSGFASRPGTTDVATVNPFLTINRAKIAQ